VPRFELSSGAGGESGGGTVRLSSGADLAFAVSDPYLSRVVHRGTATVQSCESLSTLLSTVRAGGVLLSFHPCDAAAAETKWQQVLDTSQTFCGADRTREMPAAASFLVRDRGWSPPPCSAASDADVSWPNETMIEGMSSTV